MYMQVIFFDNIKIISYVWIPIKILECSNYFEYPLQYGQSAIFLAITN